MFYCPKLLKQPIYPLNMTKFKVIRMVNQRPNRYRIIADFMQAFENEVQSYLDAG